MRLTAASLPFQIPRHPPIPHAEYQEFRLLAVSSASEARGCRICRAKDCYWVQEAFPVGAKYALLSSNSSPEIRCVDALFTLSTASFCAQREAPAIILSSSSYIAPISRGFWRPFASGGSASRDASAQISGRCRSRLIRSRFYSEPSPSLIR